MNCTRCGKPLPPGAAFCASCGQPVARAATPVGAAATMGAFDAQRKRNAVLIAVVAALAVLAAIVTGLALSGVLKFGAQKDAKTLQASGRRPTGVLEARGKTPPPILPRTDERVVMPKDVREWLEHLKRCEEQKREIVVQEYPRMTSLYAQAMLPIGSVEDVIRMSSPDDNLDSVPHSDAIGEATRRLVTRWTDLFDYFRKYPPPAVCQPLADAFGSGLIGTSQSIDDIGKIVTKLNPMEAGAANEIQNTVRELQHMQNTHKTQVDDKFEAANRELNSVCAMYNEKPWFDIDSKGNVGGLLGGVK